LKQRIPTENGILKLSGLTYQVDDHFKGGNYEIVINDVTAGIPLDKRMPSLRIELVIIDPEELAA
jgi:hypothetical protein